MVTPLLQEIGLDRRRALARSEIEAALIKQGVHIVSDHLGLALHAFRIVCIPPDLFSRLARERGWGQRPEWAYFDGYQFLQNGGLPAFVGGRAHYGGTTDMCAISPADARKNVFVRFPVVRRDRLGTRLA